MTRNRSDVDRIGDVRAAIKAPQDEEADIRGRILATGEAKVAGDDFTVTVDRRTRKSVDMDALVEDMGEDAVAPFRRATEFTSLIVKPRTAA